MSIIYLSILHVDYFTNEWFIMHIHGRILNKNGITFHLTLIIWSQKQLLNFTILLDMLGEQ